VSIIACSIDKCEKRSYARTWCDTHYRRFRRYGNPESIKREKFVSELCTLDGCDKPHEARGLCTAHYQRWRKHGDVDAVHQRWSGQASQTGVLGYGAAHDRLRAARGKADAQGCEHCDSPAVHWAYDHKDPNEISLAGRGAPYSADPAHYIPLCGSCHKLFDISA